MKYVYTVVAYQLHEGYRNVGVFSSLKQAKECADTKNPHEKWLFLSIEKSILNSYDPEYLNNWEK